MNLVQVRCWMKGCISDVPVDQFNTSCVAMGIPVKKAIFSVQEKRGKKVKMVERILNCPQCHLGDLCLPDCGDLMPVLGMWAVRAHIKEMTDAYWAEHKFYHESMMEWLQKNHPDLYLKQYGDGKLLGDRGFYHPHSQYHQKNTVQSEYERGFSAGWAAAMEKGGIK